MRVFLDGKPFQAEQGQSVLDVARSHRVAIPSLCHHEGLTPYGACRLCLVEVESGGPPGVHSSCLLPAMPDLKVLTASDRVRRARRVSAELLLARAPDVAAVREIAALCGVESTSFTPRNAKCILCGRCVRACAQLGVHAIGYAWRSIHRRVTAPFGESSADCLACRACFHVCPTGAIESTLAADRVSVTPPEGASVELERVPCARCGKPYATARSWELVRSLLPEHLRREETLCPACKRNEHVKRLMEARRMP